MKLDDIYKPAIALLIGIIVLWVITVVWLVQYGR